VRIDFAAHLIQVLDAACPPPTSEIVRLESGDCGLRIPIQVNDGPAQWMRLDTGCATALEWVTSSIAADRCPNQIAVALTGLSRPMVQTSLRMGKTDFVSVPTGLHRHEMFAGEAGLIGNGVLSQFATVMIDVPGGRLILSLPQAD
jgi:hypothetical protein